MSHNKARRKLARIRCVLEAVKAFRNDAVLPMPLCYVPLEIEYKCSSELSAEAKNKPLVVRHQPSLVAKVLGKIPHSNELRLFASGDEFSNNDGDWIKLNEVCILASVHSMLSLYWRFCDIGRKTIDSIVPRQIVCQRSSMCNLPWNNRIYCFFGIDTT